MTSKQLADALARTAGDKRVYVQGEEVSAVRELETVVLLVLHSETTAVDLLAPKAVSAAQGESHP